MKHWDLQSIGVGPRAPEVLHSQDEGRVIVLELPQGEQLSDHQVHEQAWVTVISGEVEITTEHEELAGGAGTLVAFEPGERHAVRALRTARLLLMLTPWPGPGHPGTMSLEQKTTVRERAAALNGR
jgi:quercetin dioxygenase-like cupin family protein